MRFHYITLWGENDLGRELTYSPAAMSKMKYLLSVLRDTMAPVTVASFSSGKGKFKGLHLPATTVCDAQVSIRYCATFAAANKYFRLLERLFNSIQLFFYLLFSVRKDDVVILYHERYFLPVVKLIKKIARRKIVYEVEEIYTQAANYDEQHIRKEISGLQAADAYVLINDKIASVCGFSVEKPQIVFYGSYEVGEFEVEKFDDGKIHLLYAGTLDRKKGGAWLAVNAMKYLPENYHLHVLGFGTRSEVEEIRELIAEINRQSEASASYDGVLAGADYLNFIRRCHIGLSAQNPEGDYNDTSFPSKILSYMANGLTVVSIRIDVLTISKIGAKINYYDRNIPQELAAAIENTTVTAPGKLQTDILNLDREFRQNFRQFIEQI